MLVTMTCPQDTDEKTKLQPRASPATKSLLEIVIILAKLQWGDEAAAV
jgi:hypothetical protein